MEKISQDRRMTSPRTDADPLRVVAADSDSHSDCADSPLPPHDPFDSKTTTSELQILVHQLERRLAGSATVLDRLRYRLSAEDFTRLTREYEQKLRWQESVRYDYFSDTHEFVLHMPKRKHEVVHSGFSRLLQKKIEQLCAKHQVVCPFEPLRESDIEAEQGDVFMPDDQIMCLDAEQPGLVLEVGYSQAVKDLEKKAFRIIKAGKGQIRQVVTVKLHQDSQVDLTVWRPCITSDCPPRLTAEHVDQVIRNTNAEPVPGAQLEIPMAEMAPPKLLPDSLRNETIIVTAEELCGIVKRAEDFHNNVARDRYEDFPTDLEWTLSPASSISTGLSQEDEQQQESMPEDEYKSARTFRSDKAYRSPIKMRARELNKQD